ncbi:MAG: MFS transporter [Bryobacteraceae bacterium]
MKFLLSYWRLVSGNRNFRLLWIAQIVSEIGDWFYALAIYSLILELTGRAELVSLAVVLQVLPQAILAPTTGVINDRLSRKQVMIAADVVRIFIVLGMLLVRSRETVWLIYPLLFVETIGWGFFEPARSAVIPNITDGDDVLTANTLSSTTWSFNLAVGATLGGAVAAFLGRETVFVLNALSFLVSAWCLRAMRFKEPHLQESPPMRWRDLGDLSPILEGFRYMRSDRFLGSTMMVKGGLGFLGANLVLLPVLGHRIFPVAMQGYPAERGAMLGMSVLMGSRGIGALLGPFVSSPWAGMGEGRLRRGIVFGFIAASLGYVLLSQAPSLWVACLLIVLAHGGGSTIWVFSTTLLQMYSHDRFRGRVFGTELALNMVAISISSSIAGLLVDHGISPRTAVLVTGCLLLIPAGLWSTTLRWKRTVPLGGGHSPPRAGEITPPL